MVTCRDIYWHIINLEGHIHACIQKCPNNYPEFNNGVGKIWINIFKMPFKIVRDTKIQTFQYRILHRILPCNSWLKNIKIKDSNICSFCNEVDDIPHFLLKCEKAEEL